MGKTFLVHKEIEYTYERLRIDLEAMDSGFPYLYIQDNEPYAIFLALIHSLVYDYPIEVLDGDFSVEELRELDIDPSYLTRKKLIENRMTFPNMTTILTQIEAVKNWELTLYTSGTTGRPKKVSHTFEGFTRNVKRNEKFAKDVWAFAFNPTHMAGLQVFFQALLNENTIVYTFGESISKFPHLIEQYKITCISGTSTFYRTVLPYLKKDAYRLVQRVTFGGEKYDSSLGEALEKIFPNANIRNIYASTEAGSLFTAYGDVFEIKKEYADLVQISEENELLIHQSLLGTSDTLLLDGEWFRTGDLVESIGKYYFKFITRRSDLINIGGYKVNPLEVEERLEQVPGVESILVKGRKNSVTGEILVADVVKNDEVDGKDLKKAIKQFATMHLQEWKIPRLITFVDEIPTSRTGKKVRK